jgi:hypothetical protein
MKISEQIIFLHFEFWNIKFSDSYNLPDFTPVPNRKKCRRCLHCKKVKKRLACNNVGKKEKTLSL